MKGFSTLEIGYLLNVLKSVIAKPPDYSRETDLY